MSRSVWLALMLTLGTTFAHAQSSPAQPEGYFEILPDCLSIPGATVHQCIYQFIDPSTTGDISHDPDQPEVQFAQIKGKYNTCELYPKGMGGLKGTEKGYACYSNATGACVSGDCCGILDVKC